MRLDHIAYRVKNRNKAIKFFKEAFGYKEQAEFDITLKDGSTAKCTALEPSEKNNIINDTFMHDNYHMAHEVFVSEGPKGSLIDNWVNTWGRGTGGIHHIAYEVDNVEETRKEWISKGFMFLSESTLECDDLVQIFSEPHPITGVIYEFIERKGQHGFCKDNVADLMNSTANL